MKKAKVCRVVGAKLPPELWGEIGKRLPSRLDLVRFRSVCNPWRSSLPPPSRFPLPVPPRPGASDTESHTLTELHIYPVDRPQRLLVAFAGVDQAGQIRTSVINPPPGVSPDALESPISRLSFLAKTYLLRRTIQMRLGGQFEVPYNLLVHKVALISSPNSNGVDPNYAKPSDLRVVAHLVGGQQGLLNLERSQDSTSNNSDWDTDFCGRKFADIATYRGQLCAVDYCGRAFLMDYNSLQMWQVASPVKYRETVPMHLFEASGDLFLVDPTNRVTDSRVHDLKVFKLNLRLRDWVQVKGLGNVGFVPRDLFLSDGVMKCEKSPFDGFGPPSFLFLNDRGDDEDEDESDRRLPTGYRCLSFSTHHCIRRSRWVSCISV